MMDHRGTFFWFLFLLLIFFMILFNSLLFPVLTQQWFIFSLTFSFFLINPLLNFSGSTWLWITGVLFFIPFPFTHFLYDPFQFIPFSSSHSAMVHFFPLHFRFFLFVCMCVFFPLMIHLTMIQTGNHCQNLSFHTMCYVYLIILLSTFWHILFHGQVGRGHGRGKAIVEVCLFKVVAYKTEWMWSWDGGIWSKILIWTLKCCHVAVLEDFKTQLCHIY